LSARSEDKLNALKQQLPNSDQHHVVVLDLAQPEQLAKQLKPIIAELGTIDILINNGGLSQRSIARETQLSVHRQVMEVNYFGAIGMTQALLPQMISAASGMIVTIASVAGKVGGKGMSGYSGSKHAIIGYIPVILQNTSFRTFERFMIKARILLMVVPLIRYATMSMICSDAPVGLV